MSLQEKTKSSKGKHKFALSNEAIGWILAVILSATLSILPIYNTFGKKGLVYVGGGELEGWLWRYWWMKELLKTLWHQSPRHWLSILYVYFCAGNYPETGNVFDLQTFSLILEPIFGDPLYYNIKVSLILFLNGLSGYALAKYFTKKPMVSLIGATLLTLNPYVLFEIGNGRIRQAMLFSMPLFVIYLFENYKKLTLKSALLAGFWLGLTAAIYLFYGMASLFFALSFLIYHLIFDRKNFTWIFAKYVVVILVVFILVSGPFSFRYIEMVLSNEKLPEVTYGRSFPPLSFLLKDPSQLDPRDPLSHSILRYRTDSLPVDFPINSKAIINIPLVVVILTVIPLLWVRPVPWLWIFNLLLFYILSLGPYLKTGTGSSNYVTISGKAIPLLYVVFFKYVPFFARLFAPLRMLGFFYVALVVILTVNISYTIDVLAEKKPKLKGGLEGVFVSLIIFLTIFQMYNERRFPLATTKVVFPEVYEHIKDKSRIGIIELPFRVGDYINFYQIYHHKKLLWGWAYGGVPRDFPDSIPSYLAIPNFREDNSFIRALEKLNVDPKTPMRFTKKDLEALKNAGYRYVVVHERGCYEMSPHNYAYIFDNLISQMKRIFGKPVYCGYEELKVLSSPTKRSEKFRVCLFKVK